MLNLWWIHKTKCLQTVLKQYTVLKRPYYVVLQSLGFVFGVY